MRVERAEMAISQDGGRTWTPLGEALGVEITGPPVGADLHTVLEWTGELPHLEDLLNSRVQAAGGVPESLIQGFIYAILEDLEDRIRVWPRGPQTAESLKETVHAVIEEMIQECQTGPQ